MKKLFNVIFFLVLALNLYCEEWKELKNLENLELEVKKILKYMPKINADVEFVLKNQKSYNSPFDTPAWGWDQRAGASNRDTQFMRMNANVYISYGELGKSEWFGVLSFKADPNDPDNIEGDYDSKSIKEDTLRNRNKEESKIELSNGFIMWRPFLIKDKDGKEKGRPFGITAGYQSIKATANAAYSNIFTGDIDGDFIAYTITALTEKPMIHFDLHSDEKTGIGYAFAKGNSDILKNASAFHDEYSFTHIFYAEMEKNNIGLNTAWQIAKGNREETNTKYTKYGDNWYLVNGEEINGTYNTASYKYTSNSINTMLSYEYKINKKNKIKPFLGYQKLWGEQAVSKEYQDIGKFKTKEVDSDVKTFGVVYDTKIGKYNVRFSGEYSDVWTPDFNGLSGIEDGQVDKFVESAGIQYFDQQNMMMGQNPMGEQYKMSEALFQGIAGDGKTIYTIAGLKNMAHFEIAVDMNENFTIALFYNLHKTKEPKNIKTTSKQKEEITQVFDEKLGYLTNEEAIMYGLTPGLDIAAGEVPTAEVMAETVSQSMDWVNMFGTEWTDSSSYGISLKYKF